MALNISTIRKTYNVIRPYINKTPLELSSRLSKKYGCNIFLKREDLQLTRSFKIRGSLNKISKYVNCNKKIVCASAGNHAQGVAYSCKLLGLKGTIFCPQNTPNQKLERILSLGGNSINLKICGNNFDETLDISKKYSEKYDSFFIHPFDDMDIIKGQATIGYEIYKENKNIDTILGCLGGGGLMSGISYFYENFNNTKIYGVESKGAESMKLSIEQNRIIKMKNINTFVDGSSVSEVGRKTFNICKNNLEDIFTVSNERICHEMINLHQKDGIISEPAGCLSICGLDYLDKIGKLEGKNVVCILSGGNNDLNRYPDIIKKNNEYLDSIVYI